MKTVLLLSLLGALAGPLGGAVTVEWVNPEKFRDATDYDANTPKARQIVFRDLEQFLTDRVPDYFGDAVHLTLRFHEVDLEGDFEPWRGHRANDIRIVRDLYPARLEFEWTVTDPAGQVLGEGREKLSSFGRMRPFDYDWERYMITKDLLRDWMRQAGKPYKPPRTKARS